MKDRVLISVAPVSALDREINPEKIAEDVAACSKAGAAMVHLHVRGYDGHLTEDLAVLKEIVALIRSKCDIIIQASTGGVSDLNIAQRCAPLYYEEVETCSLNVGSTNLGDAVYANPIKEVEYCVLEIIKQNKTPEIEVFELGHIHTAKELKKKFSMKEPLLFSIVLGHPGAAPATEEALVAMRSFIPDRAIWGITHAHRRNFSLIGAAVGMGAKTVRIGFEDSDYLDDNTRTDRNSDLVEKTAALLRAMDKEPMTPQEARIMLKM